MNRPYIQYNAVFPDFEELPGGGRFEIGNAFPRLQRIARCR